MKRKLPWRPALRVILALLGLFCCYRLIVGAATAGLSRLLQTSSILQARIQPVDLAVRLTPGDPEAHYTRGLTLVNLGRLGEAVAELEQTTRLRPHHYYEWLDLGVTLDRVGDQTAAVAALRESVRLAPSFAQPRWQLGNLLYRQGRFQEAFAELRLGARSMPGLSGGMIELAWVAAEGDVGTFEQLVQPQSGRRHLELARFLAKQGKGGDAARQVREAGQPRDEEERTILRETIAALCATEQFSDAYSAWATAHNQVADNGAKGQLLNGDFTQPISQNDPGFGWQLLGLANVSASLDPAGSTPGSRSLCLTFTGDNTLAIPLVHQLILLQPNSRYSLTFAAKSEDLVSGGPPVILALPAGSKNTAILGQSTSLSPGTREWSVYKVDFSTDENTSAVVIALQRLACTQVPCPIFGKLWLSGFSLVKA